jgi:uncharacterized RDD family membrane protein YckC
MDAMTYTISVGGKTYGPATLEQLQELAKRGKITAGDYIWDKEAGQWKTLGSFSDTAGFFTAAGAMTTTTTAAAQPEQAGAAGAGDITVTVKTGGGAVRNISPAQMMEAIKNHEILPNDLIWYPKGQRWLFAGSVTSLKSAFEMAQAAAIGQEEEYYVSVKGVRRGPYDKAQMESLVQSGHFDPDDQVWSPQKRAWIAISASEEFSHLLPVVVAQQYTTPVQAKPEAGQRPTIRPDHLTGLDSSAPIEAVETLAKPRQIWGRRILAAAIDAAILIMLLLISMIAWTLAGYDPLNFRTPNYDFNRALVFYSYAAICILYLLFRDAGGGSIGKRITDILVVRRKNFARADLGTSFLRNIILFVPPIIIFEFFAVLLNQKGTRIGDLLAGTVLMDASQAGFLESEVRKLG